MLAFIVDAPQVYARVMAQFGDGSSDGRPVTPKDVRASLRGDATVKAQEGLWELLRGFFLWVQQRGCREVVSLLGDDMSKSTKGWADAKARRRYCIEDPLETDIDSEQGRFDSTPSLRLNGGRHACVQLLGCSQRHR